MSVTQNYEKITVSYVVLSTIKQAMLARQDQLLEYIADDKGSDAESYWLPVLREQHDAMRALHMDVLIRQVRK